MSKIKNAIICLAASAIIITPITAHADEYDLGSGEEFTDEGCGYEDSYTSPSFVRLGLGLAVGAGLIIAAIAIADSGSSSHSH